MDGKSPTVLQLHNITCLFLNICTELTHWRYLCRAYEYRNKEQDLKWCCHREWTSRPLVRRLRSSNRFGTWERNWYFSLFQQHVVTLAIWSKVRKRALLLLSYLSGWHMEPSMWCPVMFASCVGVRLVWQESAVLVNAGAQDDEHPDNKDQMISLLTMITECLGAS